MSNLTPYASAVVPEDRLRVTHTRPAVFWMTGLSGAGKSTIAALLEKQLIDAGHAVFMLDGDTLRTGLCQGLGFSAEDRTENLRRIAECARLLALSGQIVIVCAISPSHSSRQAAREIITRSGTAVFHEVYVQASVEICAARDPKGLYKKAFAGEITDFTGVTAPYDIPENPDVTLNTAMLSAEEAAKQLFHIAIADIYRPTVLMPHMLSCAARAAHTILSVYAGEYSVSFKEDSSPLTTADTRSQEIIQQYLRTVFPEYDMLSEEETEETRDRYGIPRRLNGCGTFIVDPLDGTKEFLHRNGEFCVSIGFSDHHRVIAGVIAVPTQGTLYYAMEGYGAYKTTISNGFGTSFPEADAFLPILFQEKDRIHASTRHDALRITASRSHGDKQTEALLQANASRIDTVVTAGSCLKGCLIAEGQADLHYRYGAFMKEWDTAAMEILCREAGASFTDVHGNPICANRADPIHRNGFRILNTEASALDTSAADALDAK